MAKEWKRSISWKCLVCEGNPEFEHLEMMVHMQEVHGIDTKATTCTRTGLMCLDGQNFYSNTFEYDINGMKFLKFDTGQKI